MTPRRATKSNSNRAAPGRGAGNSTTSVDGKKRRTKILQANRLPIDTSIPQTLAQADSLIVWRPQLPCESIHEITGRLTSMHCIILSHFIESPNDKAVAKRTGLRRSTVTNHLRTIEKRLGVASRAELIKKLLLALLT